MENIFCVSNFDMHKHNNNNVNSCFMNNDFSFYGKFDMKFIFFGVILYMYNVRNVYLNTLSSLFFYTEKLKFQIKFSLAFVFIFKWKNSSVWWTPTWKNHIKKKSSIFCFLCCYHNKIEWEKKKWKRLKVKKGSYEYYLFQYICICGLSMKNVSIIVHLMCKC